MCIRDSLERGVLAGALGEVHQAHVVADHEGQRQSDQGDHGEDRGQHIQHLCQFLRLIHGPIEFIHFLHGVQLVQAGLRGTLDQQRGGRKVALAQAFPGSAFHVQALGDAVVYDLRDRDARGLIVAGEEQLQRIAHGNLQRIRQLLGDGGSAGQDVHQRFVLAHAQHRLPRLHHGQQRCPALAGRPCAHRFFHDAFYALSLIHI